MTTDTHTAAAVPTTEKLADLARKALASCGADLSALPGSDVIAAISPVTGETLMDVPAARAEDVDAVIRAARNAFLHWRTVPAPQRGAMIKRLGQLLTGHQADLADLISIEVGKIRSEALGEVQEMIDICDFAVGLSRRLEGRTMPSERPGHRLMETWHPLGVVGVISAFNFPAAVWAWNAALALVCGDAVIWKPSEKTTLVAVAASALVARAARDHGAPDGLCATLLTDAAGACPLVESPLVPLISATGSERMGAVIGPQVAARFGRTILELGGNNAAIITPTADLDLATRGIVFAAAGTAGQRCTTLRRLIVHESVAEDLAGRVASVYQSLAVGDPFTDGTLVGPLIDGHAYQAMRDAMNQAVTDGGDLIAGGDRVSTTAPNAYYVRPAIIRMPSQTDIVKKETFAPILYLLTYRTFDEAITLHNGVPQGLASAIFTGDQREAEQFMAPDGSDCGIVNVNIGTSGAEIGGAFGGEKTTGGGRESGSDAWRGYMRRATNTVNYSRALPLAQGVSFA
jgi:aldehyde dehydrogenase (NAD+)